MSDTERLVRRAGDPSRGEAVTAVTPEAAGWGWSGLEVRDLAGGRELDVDLDGREAVVVPLRGGVHLSVTGP